MIDFRYHLISLVAVLLALSCGVVLGSGVLGGPLLEDVRQRAEDVRKTNEEVRALADERLQAIDRHQAFTRASMPYVLNGALADTAVVLVTTDGTDGGMVDSIRDVVMEAEGEVTGTLRLTERLLLDDEIAVDQLALAVGSVSSDPEELSTEMGRVLGSRLAAGASADASAAADQRLQSLLDTLTGSDFLALEDAAEGGPVPDGAVFLVVAGSPEEPPFNVDALVSSLAQALASRGGAVMVGEPAGSMWRILDGDIREGELGSSVSTAGGVEDLPGQVAAALGLARALEGEAVHVGYGDSADSVLPSPVSSQPQPTPDQ